MILIVALNPALDITHQVDRVEWSGVNRPVVVHTRPGGKGLNVARTLRSIGAEVLVTGFAGGVTGEAVRAALSEYAVPAALTQVAAETRRTFAVVDAGRGQAALFNEPGPLVRPQEHAAFLAGYARTLAASTAVVLSGSLPPGLPPAAYAELCAMAAAAGVPAVLDAHGEALLRGAAARPAIVKPNLAELEGLAGRPLYGADTRSVALAAAELRAAGAQAVVVSLGADGLWAATDDGSWLARPPARMAGNPIGAGDAVTAALVHGLVSGRPWEERLRHAVALGTASVAAPVAGEFSQADYADLLDRVTVQRAWACR